MPTRPPFAAADRPPHRQLDRVNVFAFEADRRAVPIAWDAADAGTQTALPEETTCTDLVGRLVADPRVKPGPAPVYLVGEAAGARHLLAGL